MDGTLYVEYMNDGSFEGMHRNIHVDCPAAVSDNAGAWFTVEIPPFCPYCGQQAGPEDIDVQDDECEERCIAIGQLYVEEDE